MKDSLGNEWCGDGPNYANGTDCRSCKVPPTLYPGPKPSKVFFAIEIKIKIIITF